ncbi:unnamed protein product [Lota lota]
MFWSGSPSKKINPSAAGQEGKRGGGGEILVYRTCFCTPAQLQEADRVFRGAGKRFWSERCVRSPLRHMDLVSGRGGLTAILPDADGPSGRIAVKPPRPETRSMWRSGERTQRSLQNLFPAPRKTRCPAAELWGKSQQKGIAMQALLRSQLPNDVVSAPSCCWLAGVETQGAAGPGAPIAALPRAQRKDRRRDSEAEKKENIRHEIRPSSGATRGPAGRAEEAGWERVQPGQTGTLAGLQAGSARRPGDDLGGCRPDPRAAAATLSPRSASAAPGIGIEMAFEFC